ncbi:unnamed protein product [Ixodes pacificus]
MFVNCNITLYLYSKRNISSFIPHTFLYIKKRNGKVSLQITNAACSTHFHVPTHAQRAQNQIENLGAASSMPREVYLAGAYRHIASEYDDCAATNVRNGDTARVTQRHKERHRCRCAIYRCGCG